MRDRKATDKDGQPLWVVSQEEILAYMREHREWKRSRDLAKAIKGENKVGGKEFHLFRRRIQSLVEKGRVMRRVYAYPDPDGGRNRRFKHPIKYPVYEYRIRLNFDRK